MPLSWNFDPVLRNGIIFGFLLFYFFDWHFAGLLIGAHIWWGEFDEDRVGFDLEEHLEHYLDEFGRFDTWPGDVYKSAQQYGDLRENFNRTHQNRHTMFRRLYKVKDEEVIKDFDYSYWEENYYDIDKNIKNRVREGLEEEEKMYRKYKEDKAVETDEEKMQRSRHFYEQFLAARVGENIKGYWAANEEQGNIGVEDIDEQGGELEYIYLLAEKMYDWTHSTAYEENDSTFRDIEELWIQYVFTKHDKRTWKLNYTPEYPIGQRKSMIAGNKPLHINYQKELKMQPYPMFALWTADPYSIILKRKKNASDFFFLTNLLRVNQPDKERDIRHTQYEIKRTEEIKAEQRRLVWAQVEAKYKARLKIREQRVAKALEKSKKHIFRK